MERDESTLKNDEFGTLGASGQKNNMFSEREPTAQELFCEKKGESSPQLPNLISSINRITLEGIQNLRRSITKISASQAD